MIKVMDGGKLVANVTQDGIYPVTAKLCPTLPGWDECVERYKKCAAIDADHSAFNFDWYIEQDKRGALKMAVVIADDMVHGMLIVTDYYYTHTGKKMAYIDGIYCDPEYRKWGMKMFGCAEYLARELGAQGMYMSAPHGSRLAAVYEKRYKHTDDTFWKSLEHEED